MCEENCRGEIRVALRQGSVSYKKNKSTIISINKLERIVLNTAGVVDCSLTLNDGTVNVEVGEEPPTATGGEIT